MKCKILCNRFIIFAPFVIVLIVFGQPSFAALPKPSVPPYTPPKMLSPMEDMQQKQESLGKAIKNRKKRGLPVEENNVRLVDPLYAREFKPERDYSKQSCYHVTQGTDPDEFVFCNTEKCVFPDTISGYPDGGYCEQKTRDCYDSDGKLILDEKGLSVTDSQHALGIRWDMCLTKDGALVTPAGEKPFDEKIKAGCGYRVRGKTPYFKKYLRGHEGYMMTCDKYRCLFHPGAGSMYNRETKTFSNSYDTDATKTPPSEYVPYLDWTCLSGQKVNRIPERYRCSIVVEDGENWGCQVCFVNSKHVYRACKYRYNEKGEAVEKIIRIIPELEEQLDDLTQVRYRLMERDRVDIVRKMGDLEGIFHTTQASDAVQKRAVVIFQNFFDRKDDEGWTNAKLGQELATLRARIRRLINSK